MYYKVKNKPLKKMKIIGKEKVTIAFRHIGSTVLDFQQTIPFGNVTVLEWVNKQQSDVRDSEFALHNHFSSPSEFVMASDSLIVQKSRLLQPYKIELKSVNSKVEITCAMLVYGLRYQRPPMRDACRK